MGKRKHGEKIRRNWHTFPVSGNLLVLGLVMLFGMGVSLVGLLCVGLFINLLAPAWKSASVEFRLMLSGGVIAVGMMVAWLLWPAGEKEAGAEQEDELSRRRDNSGPSHGPP